MKKILILYSLIINNYMEKVIYVAFTDSHSRLVLLFRLTIRLIISIFVFVTKYNLSGVCSHIDAHMTQSYIIY